MAKYHGAAVSVVGEVAHRVQVVLVTEQVAYPGFGPVEPPCVIVRYNVCEADVPLTQQLATHDAAVPVMP